MGTAALTLFSYHETWGAFWMLTYTVLCGISWLILLCGIDASNIAEYKVRVLAALLPFIADVFLLFFWWFLLAQDGDDMSTLALVVTGLVVLESRLYWVPFKERMQDVVDFFKS